MSIAIVGSRNYPRLQDVVEYVKSLPDGVTVISGGARGVDQTAESAARARGLRVVSYPADWDFYGKSAGLIRNIEIVKAADALVAFWDGKSRGTQHSIGLARRAAKPVTIVRADSASPQPPRGTE